MHIRCTLRPQFLNHSEKEVLDGSQSHNVRQEFALLCMGRMNEDHWSSSRNHRTGLSVVNSGCR